MPSRLFPAAVLLVTVGLLSACGGLDPYVGSGGPNRLDPVVADRQMVVASHPLASEAGLDVLREGGSALDAAIAAAMVMGVVEPGSSGIGGGGFLMHYAAATGAIDYYDGRETAPKSATPYMFMDGTGNTLDYTKAAQSGIAIGVPGQVRLLALAHREHGRLSWERLLAPAIAVAREGFAMYPRLNRALNRRSDLAARADVGALYFTPSGPAKGVGTVIQNTAMADALETIAKKGADAFYRGAIADAVIDAANDEPRPARMGLADLSTYAAKKREPVCSFYRVWLVCGAAPPSSGGLAVAQMLGILQPFDLAALEPTSADAAHLIAEAGRLAFADRGAYVADPDFISVPQAGLLDPGYLEARAARIRMDQSLGITEPGKPAGAPDGQSGTAEENRNDDTAHLSVIDADGNAVALTLSLATTFGSGRMADGFFLNSQLTDFAFRPNADGKPVANRAAPGKRPRSSMSPTLVFDGTGKVVLAIGSPGGSRIIGYVAQAMMAVLDWKLDVQKAVNLGHVVNRNGKTDVERGTAFEYTQSTLAGRGHDVQVRALTSGLNAIQVKEGKLYGGADLRRVGKAMGD